MFLAVVEYGHWRRYTVWGCGVFSQHGRCWAFRVTRSGLDLRPWFNRIVLRDDIRDRDLPVWGADSPDW